jgi:polar amino acid transport system ATP-binding protein
MNNELVRAINVSKYFGNMTALDKVNLTVNEGEVCCIIGPSGSGKSTFLRCINMLEHMDSGVIWVGNELIGLRYEDDKLRELKDHEVAAQRRQIGMVFQHFNLFPHMTVLENLTESPIKVLGERASKAREYAIELLERVGLKNRADSYPIQLSGGQQQRVAIARALCMRPRLMLFDEPTSALDPELVSEVLDVMRELAQSGMTMIVVTHELKFAQQVADAVVFMDKGKVVEAGSPDEVLMNPKDARSVAFMKAINN